MGASVFFQKAMGTSPKAAFSAARAQALYDHGHAGYSGTLAEKHSFVEIKAPDGLDPSGYAEKLISDGDVRVDDKCGPAGCVRVGPEEFLFFGWASS
jgi:hypothetical protein